MKRKYQIEAKKKTVINFGGCLSRVQKLNKQWVRNSSETKLSFTVKSEGGEYVPKVNIDDIPVHSFDYKP